MARGRSDGRVPPKVVSKVFTHLRQREGRENRKYTVDQLALEVGLAPKTVRRFIAIDGDITNSPLGYAALWAEWFGVDVREVIDILPRESNADAPGEISVNAEGNS